MQNLVQSAKAALLALVAVLLGLTTTSACAAGYVGNAFGTEGRYQIFEFTDKGMALKPVSGARYAAWPSAIQIENTKVVYASENVGGKWAHIRKWISVDGGAYADAGVVFAAGHHEPNGIGPATVTFDGTTFRIFYLVRGGQDGAHVIGLATSTDGTNFTRSGIAFSDTSPDVGTISVSYACTDAGESFLLLHFYNANLTAAMSVLAVSSDADGPYTADTVIMNESGVGGTITGIAGNQFATFSGGMRVGTPVVVLGNQPSPYVAMQIKGNSVYFDRPLAETISQTPWAEHVKNKADVSFISKRPEGWFGAVTGYGQFANVTSEFTSPISAAHARGPWKIESGYFLQPYFNSGKYSTENPEPIRADASCG